MLKTIIFAGIIELNSEVMKKVFSIAGSGCMLALRSDCSKTPRSAYYESAELLIEFETTEHDFGTIPCRGRWHL